MDRFPAMTRLLRKTVMLLVVFPVLLDCVRARAAEPVDYLRDIKPILEKRCYACHGANRQQGALRLDTAAFARQGGEQGPALVPGESSASLIIEAITGDAESWRMPPPEEGEALSANEIALLRAWIDAGAPAPADEAAQADPRAHWAFQTPRRPELPVLPDAAWMRTPVDAFVAEQHARQGLIAQPEAPRDVLLRRVYLDLIGIPPTPEQLAAFLADTSPQAFERVVDELLDSPLYGQRWGRHWMDVWRYSDWYGYGEEIRNSQRHIWRWRDWIVESLNADRGYDQMVREMLAGDEIAPEDPDTLRATGFLARQWFKFNRNVWLDGTVEHTGKAFLGLTLNCARCHDHKYDPIAQKEYFQFRALFEPYDVRTDMVPGVPDLMKDGLPRIFDANLTTPTFLFERGDEAHPRTDEPLAPAVPAVIGNADLAINPVTLPPASYYPALRPHVAEPMLAEAAAKVTAQQQAIAAAREQHAAAAAQLAALARHADETLAGADSFLSDDFASASEQLWQQGPGQWEYRDGHLEQHQTGATECRLVSQVTHPEDFEVTLRLRITGGEQWKSMGLSFDTNDDGSFTGVYLSAYAGGPKLQIYHSAAGTQEYPAAGTKSLPVQLNTEYTLRVEVRGALMNVWLDDQLQLAYRIPRPRVAGKLVLWTFDATGQLLGVRAAHLRPELVLVESVPAAGTAGPARTLAAAERQVADAQHAVLLAERQAEVAAADQASLVARLDAARAQHADPRPHNATALAQAASAAERQQAVKQAELEELMAAHEVEVAARGGEAAAAARAEAEKKLAAAREKLAAAHAAVTTPSEQYSPVGTQYPQTSSGRRLALARWVTDRANPLTARVAINHLWLRHFGSPLVPTVFDFGNNGQPPTHPELLDWLAVEFMDSGWSMKHIHRLLVNSATYRQQSWPSVAAAENQARDQDNHYLWRANARRMEAEVVRDSILSVAGHLDVQAGGPTLPHAAGETTFRRSMYYQHAAEKQMTFLVMFDVASVNECYRRSESIVPQQALALANSTLVQREGRALARELTTNLTATGATDDEAFVQTLFQRVLTRPASADEVNTCKEFLKQQTLLLSDPARLTTFTAGADAGLAPATDPALRARENLAQVLLNHTDFVTIR